MPTYNEFNKMSKAKLLKILKDNGITGYSKFDKDTLADSVHQFYGAGMLKGGPQDPIGPVKKVAGGLIKVGAKGIAKKSLRSKSKTKQAKEGMGTADKYRVESATRGKRVRGVAAQLASDKQKLLNLKEAKKSTTNKSDIAELTEKINILANKIKNMKKRFNLKKEGGKVGMENPKTLSDAITEKAKKDFDPKKPKESARKMAPYFGKFKKKKGFRHDLDPLHPMNTEGQKPPKNRASLARRKSGGKVGNRLY